MKASALIGALAAVVVLVGGYFVLAPAFDETRIIDRPVGSVSGPDLLSPYFCVGGVCGWHATAKLASASTTCSFKSPAATTTLVAATVRFDWVSTIATQWQIAKAVDPYSSTTLIAHLALGAGAAGDLVATTSETALTNGIVPPNQYINVKIATTTATFTGWAPLGRCSVVFREI